MIQTATAVDVGALSLDEEHYFKKLLSGANTTISKVRRIDIEELLELAYVDGMAQPFAARLLRSRPELTGDVERVLSELSASN